MPCVLLRGSNRCGGLLCLEKGDYITSTHRGHGHALARGASPGRMFAELFGKAEGYNKGKGGSMHIADVESGILGATGIVAAALPCCRGCSLGKASEEWESITQLFRGRSLQPGPFFGNSEHGGSLDLPVVFLVRV